MITRRTAVLSGASVLALSACGGRPARTIAGDPSDLRVLAAAVEAERAQVALYEAGAQLSDASILREILEQERAHLAAIDEAMRELGGGPAPARPVTRFSLNRGFGSWRREAIKRENQWSAGYAVLIPKLSNPRLRSTFGALMTTEAEHAVALELAG